MAEFPAFPLWTDAYLGDTIHLTTLEHGAYLLLLFTAWRTPTYDLPDDDKMLAKFCRLSNAQWLRIKPTITGYWRLENGRWSNGRLLDERDAVRRKLLQRSDAGKASALKRLNRMATNVQRGVNGKATSKATATPISEETSLRDVIPTAEIIPIQTLKEKRSRRSLPLNFPGPPELEWADVYWLKRGRSDLCNNISEEVDKFRDHHSGKLTSSADWPGSWRTWARNAIKFNNGGHNGRNTGTRKRTALDEHLAGLASLHSGFGAPDERGGTESADAERRCDPSIAGKIGD